MKRLRANAKSEALLLAEETAILDATELVTLAMEAAGVSKAELASRLSVSASEVTQRLQGRRNLTLRSLVSMLYVLDHRLTLSTTCAEPSHQRSVHFMSERQRYSMRQNALTYREPQVASRSAQ